MMNREEGGSPLRYPLNGALPRNAPLGGLEPPRTPQRWASAEPLIAPYHTLWIAAEERKSGIWGRVFGRAVPEAAWDGGMREDNHGGHGVLVRNPVSSV
jgi:hypothetical protein